jgi:hypothetical protein
MLFGGGMMRFGTYLEDNRAEHARRLIDAGVDDSTILTSPQKVKAALGKVWDAYQEFGDRMENVNRSALYKQLVAQGKTHQEAAFAARDMMDFSMQGSWVAVRFLTQVVPFLNARAQGLYKLGRAAKENPKRMGYVTGAVALASIALMLAYGTTTTGSSARTGIATHTGGSRSATPPTAFRSRSRSGPSARSPSADSSS